MEIPGRRTIPHCSSARSGSGSKTRRVPVSVGGGTPCQWVSPLGGNAPLATGRASRSIHASPARWPRKRATWPRRWLGPWSPTPISRSGSGSSRPVWQRHDHHRATPDVRASVANDGLPRHFRARLPDRTPPRTRLLHRRHGQGARRHHPGARDAWRGERPRRQGPDVSERSTVIRRRLPQPDGRLGALDRQADHR